MNGIVYLVGAGPGDPGLLTVKGREALAQADVVVYDRLVDPALLDYAPPAAERQFVGKARGAQELSQAGINALLVARAAQGRRVVRLKGGDPFVFGRGGEEALALADAGLPFEIVPGVTSAVAAAAYAGIPLTHRGLAASFTVASGSEDPDKPESSIDWDALARSLALGGGTLAVLMGWAALERILERLAGQGLPPDTPVALVQWGTWNRQRTVTGTLADAAQVGRAAGLSPPVVAVIGEVVKLRERLAWFDRRPLFGQRALLTRSRTQASGLRRRLEQAGAETVELPSIRIAPPEDYAAMDAALDNLGSYDWVIFASANAVEAVFQRLQTRRPAPAPGKAAFSDAASGKVLPNDATPGDAAPTAGPAFGDARAFGGIRVGAIGPATAAALQQQGIRPDFVPSRATSAAALAELSALDWAGRKALLPAADIGRDALARGLAEQGAQVDWLPVYRNLPDPEAPARARQAFASGIDLVTFTSSSTVRNLLAALDGDRSPLEAAFIACIGPVTAGAARDLGLRVDLEAEEHTVEGLAAALITHYAARNGGRPGGQAG